MYEIRDRDALLGEFEGVELGDARLDRRLTRIVEQVAASPGNSFPEQMESEAEQEALYRFLANPKVTMDAMLKGHRRQTLSRIGTKRFVRVVHDTSEFTFPGARAGLAKLKGGKSGFLGHFSLAIAADDSREPYGVLAVHPFVNTGEKYKLPIAEQQKLSRRTPRAEKKSSRWERLAIEVAAMLPSGAEGIHLMDQEADDYTVFSALQQRGLRFVIRGDAKRYTADGASIAVALAKQPTVLMRTVRLAKRSKKRATRQHPSREERLASLHLRAGQVVLARPGSAGRDTPSSLVVNAVHVFEPSPPDGETPIDWMLLTSEPISTSDEIAAIVDHYRARWVIEEYFKALKTGCAVEKRQLCSLGGLLRAVAVFVPMAWMLLALRHLGRDASPRNADALLDSRQLVLLRALLTKRGRRLADDPTVRDVMLGIAGLGGHIRNNGDPGWLVLARGWRRFADAEEVWLLMEDPINR